LVPVIKIAQDKSIEQFVSNRVAVAAGAKKLLPIGFILGPYYFHKKGDKWPKTRLPMTDVGQVREWDYVGIYSTGTDIAPGKWMPRFRIRPRLIKTFDQRAQRVGMGCRSVERSELIKMYKIILGKDVPSQKENMCNDIKMGLTQKQVGSKDRMTYSYFDITPTHI